MKRPFEIWQRLLIIAIFAAAAGGVLWLRGTSQNGLEEALTPDSQVPPAELLALAKERLQEHPEDAVALCAAIDASRALNDLPGELEFLSRLEIDGSEENAERIRRRAELERRSGRPAQAAAVLEAVLKERPQDNATRSQLAELYAAFGQRYRAVVLTREVLEQGTPTKPDLIRLALNGRQPESPSMLDRLALQAGNAPDPLLAHGLIVLAEMRRDAVDLERILDQQSNSAALLRHSIRAAMASETLKSSAVSLLVLQLSDPDVHPDSLMLAAEIELEDGNDIQALAALRLSLRLDPWNLRGLALLEGVLRDRQPEQAKRARSVRSQLERIEQTARQLQNADDVDRRIQIARALAGVGRFEEAAAWARSAPASEERQAVFRVVADRRDPAIPYPSIETLISLAEIRASLNAWDASRLSSPVAPVQLTDAAEAAGLDFTYLNGAVSGQEGLFMHQWTGGGVAVLDLDNDLWPDLLFPQGGNRENPAVVAEDGLFRNLRGTRFESVRAVAMRHGGGFGQGVAAGDVDNDGFTDLLIGRAGANVLLLNQGDGTFLESETYPAVKSWTTSVAIADLNGDSSPDIYEVNYLEGETVYRQRCDHDGRQRICAPTDFAPAPDRLLLSDGAGGFVPEDLSAIQPDRGMGVMVAELDGTAGVDICVANDEGPNQLLTLRDGRVVDQGIVSGVAYGHDGRALGSMGIALGDPLNDGRPALFMTNYYSEPNNFYRSVLPGSFVDQTAAVQLLQPGYSMLGFGCSIRDMNGDGTEDLIVANGHLDDFTHFGHPFRMPTQVCLNTGDGQFQLATEVEGYLSDRHLGRSVVTMDWNGDGAPDVVVTHLDTPVALLENQQSFDELSIQIVGTQSARDAVGAVVSTADTCRFVTSGDGYQSSGSRWIPLSLSGEEIRVDLPGKDRQQITHPQSRGMYRFVEHRTRLYWLPW